MATVHHTKTSAWTAADLVERFGPILLARVVWNPAPGEGTVEDVVRLNDYEKRRCELIDGVLLEKTMGAWESLIAGQLVTLLNLYLANNKLGLAFTTDGMMQIMPDQIRIPDAAFVSWQSLEGSGFPEEAAPLMAPDLAVEVISPGNTQREMERKLEEYFEAGVRLVWYVEPREKKVTVYTRPDVAVVLGEADQLTGGEVLPGLVIELKDLFAAPMAPGK
jgi:Uma2 family endonuclease